MAQTVPDTLPAGAPGGETETLESLETVEPGRYTHRAVLARGGMGKIVTAYDRRLRRTVAIKEMQEAHPELIARFEREIVLTAMLEHPAIVTVHDAGRWPGGELFYAMRLVPGRSLADAIAAARTLPARLALVPHVIAVADALAYAHGQHVIHRDLKPQNVMIGEFGETVVIDWGLAKQLGSRRTSSTSIETGSGDGKTEIGAVLGTPAYMPPEQAAGVPTDERGDVYSIGAILYEVLAGRPPYEGATTEILDEVKHRPPPELDAPTLPADLLAIVRRAMARDAPDRYPSAKELADDLRAFQAGRLVGAHRYSRRERFARWVRRHRAAVGVGACAVLALAGLATVSVIRIVEARHVAEAERATAVQNRAQAEDLVKFILEDLQRRLNPVIQMDVLGSLLDKAQSYYASRPAPSTRDDFLRLASLHDGRSTIALMKGNASDAAAEARAELELLSHVPERDGKVVERLRAANVALGDALRAKGDTPGAMDAYRSALAITARALASDPDNAGFLHLDGITHGTIAAVLMARPDLPGALAEQRIALSEIERALTHHGDDLIRRSLAHAHEQMGMILRVQGKAADALAEYQTMRDVSAAGTDKLVFDDLLTAAHEHLGNAYADLGKNKESLAEHREALAGFERLLARTPDNQELQANLILAALNVAGILQEQEHDQPGALREVGRAIEIASNSATVHPESVELQNDLAYALTTRAEVLADTAPDKALADARDALAIRDKLSAKDPTPQRTFDAVQVHVVIGRLLAAKGDKPAARAELASTREVLAKLVHDNPADADWKEQLADIDAALSKI